jgi:FkbM family methyltransferase
MQLEKLYEPETVRIFTKVLTPGDAVIIAGAHQGYFASICADLVGPTGRVLAFEPEPENFRLLAAKVGHHPQVVLHNFALADKEVEKAAFFVNRDNDGGHALWDVSKNPGNTKTQEKPEVVQTQIRTLDGLFPDGIENLKLVMLDAEGSEHSIIRGGINAIADAEAPYIICEINNFALKQSQTSQMSLRGYLSMYGYIAYAMNENEVVLINPLEEVKALIPDTEQEVVFNILFSRRGKV